MQSPQEVTGWNRIFRVQVKMVKSKGDVEVGWSQDGKGCSSLAPRFNKPWLHNDTFKLMGLGLLDYQQWNAEVQRKSDFCWDLAGSSVKKKEPT